MFKNLFSTFKYSSGKLIYSNNSSTHPIEVRENWRFRWLHFGGPSIQSAMKKRAPNELALPYLSTLFKGIHLFAPSEAQVTLLGIGGGAIIRYTREYFPNWKITGIEIDPAMIDLSSRYFALPDEDERLNILVADAVDFLHHPLHQADIVISDIYSNEKLPDVIHQNEFYEMIYAHLTENGLFCLNVVYENDIELLGVISAVQSVFDKQTLLVKVKGYRNAIIFAGKNPEFVNEIQTIKRNQLTGLRLDSLYGYMATLP